jgi:hypothetical protein
MRELSTGSPIGDEYSFLAAEPLGENPLIQKVLDAGVIKRSDVLARINRPHVNKALSPIEFYAGLGTSAQLNLPDEAINQLPPNLRESVVTTQQGARYLVVAGANLEALHGSRYLPMVVRPIGVVDGTLSEDDIRTHREGLVVPAFVNLYANDPDYGSLERQLLYYLITRPLDSEGRVNGIDVVAADAKTGTIRHDLSAEHYQGLELKPSLRGFTPLVEVQNGVARYQWQVNYVI